jgi:hypothetical protein
VPQQVYIPIDSLAPGPLKDFEETSSNPTKPLIGVVKTFLESDLQQTLLIHGPAGSGKTVFMRQLQLYIAGTFCSERLAEGEHVIVLVSALPTLTNPLTNLFEETLKAGYGFRDTQVHELRDKIREDVAMRVVFILDGYDEMRADYLFRNLYAMNNLESHRYHGADTGTNSSSVWPKVLILCRSELLSGQDNYCESFFPLESESIDKNNPEEAAKFFDEVRIAPFESKFAPYCLAYVALHLRKHFELMFGSFGGIAQDDFFEHLDFPTKDNLLEQVKSAFHVVTIGGHHNTGSHSSEKLAQLPDRVMEKYISLSEACSWPQENEHERHLLAIVAVFTAVKEVDGDYVNANGKVQFGRIDVAESMAFLEDHKNTWTATKFLDEFRAIPELRELTTT